MPRLDSYLDKADDFLIHEILEEKKTYLFEIIYERYYRKVLDRCFGLIKNREVAEELTEDILSKTYEKLMDFKGSSRFSSWLYSIAYNHCIDYLRKQKKLHYPEWNRQNELPEIVDEIEEQLTEPMIEELMVLLEKVHPEEKALLLMKYQENLPVKDIATALRISESAAKMRIKRARARIIYLYMKMDAGTAK